MTTIEEGAFAYCYNLTSVTSLAVTPPECNGDERVFKGVNKQNCTLYVPSGCKEAYQQANEWSEFVLVEEVEAGIEAVEAAADGAVEVFNLTGAKVADSTESLPAGIYLVRRGSTVSKIVVK